jgi:hypothetical protein
MTYPSDRPLDQGPPAWMVDAYQRTCPRCGAEPGEPCVALRPQLEGRTLPYPHAARAG